ncbi:MAG: tetratricopeptide repeat protein [Planctomycetes bacterium]|nr:tetratricopeptide repeat protein [Planctomycetota bacterium]
MRLTTASTLLALALCLGGCGLSETEEMERDLYNRNGLSYYQNGQYDRARDQFERSLTIDPDQQEARLLLAYSYLLAPEGNLILDAYEAFQVCAEDYGDDFRAHLGLGVACFLFGVYYEMEAQQKEDEAAGRREAYEKDEVKRDSDLREIERLDAEAEKDRWRTGEWYAEADPSLRRAQEIEPKNPFLMQMVAFNLVKLGAARFPEAEKYLAMFVEFRGKDIAAYHANLENAKHQGILTIEEERDTELAIRDVAKEIRKARSFIAYMHYTQAVQQGVSARASEEHLAIAERELREAAIVDPTNPIPHLNQFHVYWKQALLAEEQGNAEELAKYMGLAKNELYLFTQMNQFQRPDLNVFARETIGGIESVLQKIEKKPEEKEGDGGEGEGEGAAPGDSGTPRENR